MVRTPAFLVGSGKVTASCKLEQIITGASAKAIERVTLYVSKTQFVDSRTSLASVDLKGADIKDLNAVSLTSDFPAIVGQRYAYARIGVKSVESRICSFRPYKRFTPNARTLSSRATRFSCFITRWP
ncbi:DUF3823 domain-containing protein [Spirosoma oryzicola]|uniref:DUF3823 domain-containing protein n=1 Tax=Spirosoma oryzicola TaxID=2898794 RepID=UPI001E643E38|nr:DUF3823 domain-containing protein [Spirosoma oryzicola]UHG94089.1 DUF3823 domain-containing protein [Spirosoma oryzicola]